MSRRTVVTGLACALALPVIAAPPAAAEPTAPSASRPGHLDAAAEALDLGGAEFVTRYRPAEWLGDRGGALGGPRY